MGIRPISLCLYPRRDVFDEIQVSYVNTDIQYLVFIPNE